MSKWKDRMSKWLNWPDGPMSKEAKSAHYQRMRLFIGILGSIMLVLALLPAPRPFQGYMLLLVIFGPCHLACWAYVEWRRKRAQSGAQQQEDK